MDTSSEGVAAAPPEGVPDVLDGGAVVEGEAVERAGDAAEHVLRLHHARAAAVAVHRPGGHGEDPRGVQPVRALAAAVHLPVLEAPQRPRRQQVRRQRVHRDIMICGRPCRIHRQDMKQLLFFELDMQERTRRIAGQSSHE